MQSGTCVSAHTEVVSSSSRSGDLHDFVDLTTPLLTIAILVSDFVFAVVADGLVGDSDKITQSQERRCIASLLTLFPSNCDVRFDSTARSIAVSEPVSAHSVVVE